MKKGVFRFLLSFVTFVFGMSLYTPLVQAETVNLPILAFREVRIKGDNDFLFLQANAELQMGDYWLSYDSDPLAPSVPEYPLPSGVLKTSEVLILMSNQAVPTCDAAYAADIPMALAETKGSVGLWRASRAKDGRTLTFEYVDGFTWTTTASGTADIVRPTAKEASFANPTWYRNLGVGIVTWNVANLERSEQGCVLQNAAKQTVTEHATPVSNTQITPPQEMPETADDSTATDDSEENTAPVVAQIAPVITELLPNPAGTGTDTDQEFIELYNPNDTAFDVSGMRLQSGLTTKHTYTFPSGTLLAAKSFTGFFTSITSLSQSNSGGQATLLDKDNTVLSQSDPYSTAPDGQSWALYDGEWQWTATPSAGALNVVTRTASAVKAATTVAKAVKTATKTPASTTAKAKSTATAAKSKSTTAKAKATTAATTKKKTPVAPNRTVHPGILALVVAGALGYGLYEYRQDMANAFHQFRANRTARRANRK